MRIKWNITRLQDLLNFEEGAGFEADRRGFPDPPVFLSKESVAVDLYISGFTLFLMLAATIVITHLYPQQAKRILMAIRRRIAVIESYFKQDPAPQYPSINAGLFAMYNSTDGVHIVGPIDPPPFNEVVVAPPQADPPPLCNSSEHLSRIIVPEDENDCAIPNEGDPLLRACEPLIFKNSPLANRIESC